MLDPWTDKLFWPALVGAWTGGIASVAALTFPQVFLVILRPTSLALATLGAVMFLIMLIDSPTRRAVKAFNSHAMAQRRKTTWADKLFSRDYGDLRLLIINRLAWLELLFFIVIGRQELALLCFESFAISTIMIMLAMKRHGVGLLANGG